MTDFTEMVRGMRERTERRREDRKCVLPGCPKEYDRPSHRFCLKHFNMLKQSHRNALFDPTQANAHEAAIEYLDKIENRGMA